nr:MAG TPA: hypothetical protein [Bacteriophage sp.]
MHKTLKCRHIAHKEGRKLIMRLLFYFINQYL